MDLDFLGVGNSTYSPERKNSAYLISEGENRFLFDCGSGTLDELLKRGIDPLEIKEIFISHGHLDHFVGLSDLIIWFDQFGIEFPKIKTMDPEYIAGRIIPLFEHVDGTCWLHHPLRFEEFSPGSRIELTKHISVEAVKVSHTYDSVGYIIQNISLEIDLRKAYRLGVLDFHQNNLTNLRLEEKVEIFKVQYPSSFFLKKNPSPFTIGLIPDMDYLTQPIGELTNHFSSMDLLIMDGTHPGIRKPGSLKHSSSLELSKVFRWLDPSLGVVVHRGDGNLYLQRHFASIFFSRIFFPSLLSINNRLKF